MIVSFSAKVTAVTEHFIKRHVGGIGPLAKFEVISRGWFISLEGSYEALFVGTKPAISIGAVATVTISIPESSNANP